MIRPSYRSILTLVTSIAVAAPVVAQQVPTDPPVYDAIYTDIPTVRIVPHATYVPWSAWTGIDPDATEQVLQLLVTYPRQRPRWRTIHHWDFYVPPLPGTEFGGRIYAHGQGDRRDCLKYLGDREASAPHQTMRDRWEGEIDYSTITFPCVAYSLFLRMSGGVVVGARGDYDYGHGCPPDTSENFGLYRYSTPNMIPSGRWEATSVSATPNIINNAGTLSQMRTVTGTAPMWFWLFQTQARSDTPYTAPARNGNGYGLAATYPQYNGGLYFELVSDLVINRRSYAGVPHDRATFRVRKWGWEYTPSGLFSFLGDWFAGNAHAGLCDGAGGCEATDVFAFLSLWYEGS